LQGGVFEYRLIAEAIPQIVWIADASGKAEFFNARWFDYTGMRPEECVGNGWADAIHPDDADRVATLRRPTLETGEMFETEFRLRDRGGGFRWFLVRALPMRDGGGDIAVWMGTCTDIQMHKQAELRLRFLLEAGRALATSLEPAGIARDLARLVVPQFADYCQIFALEGTAFRPLAIEHRNTALIPTLHETNERFPLSPESPAIAALFARGQPVAVPDITESIRDLSARGPEHLALLRRLDARSSIVVPLVARGVRVGLFSIVFSDSGRRYGAEDIGVARDVARQLSSALANANLYQHERSVANALQDAMLPRRLPSLPGMRMHAHYLPGESSLQVGGDWYDAFALPDGTVGVSIGDVTGHGLEAALIMGEIRQAIRSASIEKMPPAAVLDHADRVLRMAHPDAIATAGFGIYDPRSRVLRYAQGGHPLPLIGVPGGAVEAVHAEGLPIGMRDMGPGTETAVTLARGSLTVFYTDGMTEYDRNAVAGERVLREAIGLELHDPHPNPALGIFRRVQIGEGSLADDSAIMTLQVE